MFSPLLSIKERIIYSALPDGFTNSISIKNVTLDKAPVSIHRAVHALLEEKALTESCYKYRDPKFNRPRDLHFYRLTPEGIETYFPALAVRVPAIAAWFSLSPNCEDLSIVARANAARRERTLRVLECEKFCSAAGILTALDKRAARSSSVFGCESDSPDSDNSQNEDNFSLESDALEAETDSTVSPSLQDILNESAKLGAQNAILSDALLPSDPYSFYRAKEIVTLPKAGQSSGVKDIAVIRSQYIGAVANQTTGFIIYRAPRYNGMDWVPKMETRVQMGVNNFCRRYIPKCKISVFAPIQNAILFYRTDQELLNILVKARSLFELGLPFKNVYAVPFSSEGLRVFREILLSPDFDEERITRVCEADPSFSSTRGASLYRLQYFGSIPCLSAFPLEIRRTARVLNAKESGSFSVAGYPWQQEIFAKLFPDIAFLGMDI